MCSFAEECVLLLVNVFSYYKVSEESIIPEEARRADLPLRLDDGSNKFGNISVFVGPYGAYAQALAPAAGGGGGGGGGEGLDASAVAGGSGGDAGPRTVIITRFTHTPARLCVCVCARARTWYT